jgi:hypothetical protein
MGKRIRNLLFGGLLIAAAWYGLVQLVRAVAAQN